MRLTSRVTSGGLIGIVGTAIVWLAASDVAGAETTRTLTIRGRPQTLHLYGPPDGDPIIVSSGDGGWIHLGPHVAEFLAAKGYFVVGFDVRGDLSRFTARRGEVE